MYQCYDNKVFIRAHNLFKSYGADLVLNDVSVVINEGEIVLLEGDNGSGKTTLINILTGNIEPDSGELFINRKSESNNYHWEKKKNSIRFIGKQYNPQTFYKYGIGKIWQDIHLFSSLTVLDNVAVAFNHQLGENPFNVILKRKVKNNEIKNLIDSKKTLSLFGMDKYYQSSCDKISMGQMKRVTISRSIRSGVKLLFLDELFSGLDQIGKDRVLQYLLPLVKEKSITLVIVEHMIHLKELMPFVDYIWTINNGSLISKKYIHKEKINSLDNKKIDFNDIFPLKSNILYYRLLNTINAVPSIIKLSGGLEIHRFRSEYDELALSVRNISVDRGNRRVINELSFDIKKGQLIVIMAPNGWGKSTLLDALLGVIPISGGKIYMKNLDISRISTHRRIKLGISYMRSFSDPFYSLTIKENKTLIRNQVQLFDDINYDKKTSTLSGGQKKKLLFDMLPKGQIYIFDEPFQGIDESTVNKLLIFLKKSLDDGKSFILAIPVEIY